MLRIAICDDQEEARDALRFGLEKLMIEESEEIVYEFSSGRGAVRWLKNHPGEIDLLFLDVEMEGLSGMETAREIRQFDRELMIVFVTGYSDYVFDGYQVEALDYCLKPVGTERLSELLKRVRRQIFQKTEEMYILKNADGIFRIPQSSIDYFYSDKRKAVLVSGEKEFAFYGKLDEVCGALPGFIRIHQRYLVNPSSVEKIAGSHVRIKGKELPISRALKEEALSRLARALLGGMEL